MRLPVLFAAVMSLVPVSSQTCHAVTIGSRLFQDDMVLQSDLPVRIWGTAQQELRDIMEAETVTVSIAGFQKSTVPDTGGYWVVSMGPLPSGGPYELRIKGENTVVYRNVMVGEVWLLWGQSNMTQELEKLPALAPDTATADYPDIRLCLHRQRWDLHDPELDSIFQREWVPCSPHTSRWYTAVAYYFARQLHTTLGVPVGIILRAATGTQVPTWLPRTTVIDPETDVFFARFRALQNDTGTHQRWYDQAMADWWKQADMAYEGGYPAPRQPAKPTTLRAKWGHNYDGYMPYIQPYTIRGVIQWEGDGTDNWDIFRSIQPSIVKAYRREFGQPNMPYFFMQLPVGRGRMGVTVEPDPLPSTPPRDPIEAIKRNVWLSAARVIPNSGMVISYDFPGDVHPPNYDVSGSRFARLALAKVYGKDIIYSGPVYDTFAVKGSSIRIRFLKGTVDTLVAGGSVPLQGFMIAGADREWAWATAEIKGREILVTSPQVPSPVAVRYAWGDGRWPNLYGTGGEIASPFRTDDWPLPGEKFTPQQPTSVAHDGCERLLLSRAHDGAPGKAGSCFNLLGQLYRYPVHGRHTAHATPGIVITTTGKNARKGTVFRGLP